MTARAVLEAERAAREARRNRFVRIVARSGYGASAVLRALIGVFALLLALHAPGPEADASGVFASIARVPGGVVLLLVLAVGEAGLGLWLVLSGVLQRSSEPLERWRLRAVDWGRAVVYLVIGATALRIALGASADAVGTDRRLGRDLLESPGGVAVLLLLGAVVVVTGLGMAWIGAFVRFRRTIRVPRGRARRAAVLTLGVAGYVLQGVSIAAVGVFLLLAALALGPGRSFGLSATFGALAGDPVGRTALLVFAAGWILAAVYAGIRTALARLD